MLLIAFPIRLCFFKRLSIYVFFRNSMIRNVKNLQKKGKISVINSSICKKIIDLRKKNDCSQTTLAKKLGISKSTMSKIENDSRKITTDELIRLAEIFDSSSDYLLGLQNNSCPTTSI